MENFNHWAILKCQNHGFIFSLLSQKNTIILQYLGYFCQETGWGHKSKSYNKKFDKSYLIHLISAQLSVNKFWFQDFSNFVAIDHKGHFRKILAHIFKSNGFSWYYTYIFEKMS